MKVLNIFVLIMIAWLFNSCSYLDESERFIDVNLASAKRAVLIEDFTGQRCVNCPDASLEIEKLQEQYGEENIIAVSIHSGPLAVWPTKQTTGLRTELGDTYYDYWKVEMEPAALINRKSGVLTQSKWMASVYDELQIQTPVELQATCSLMESGDISVTVVSLALEPIKGKLQIWLVEDGIVAPQMMPDGTLDSQYIHQHVLRAAMNGTWGEDIKWEAGESNNYQFSDSPLAEWNIRQMSVVAFIYNDKGVLQVVKRKIISNN